MFNDDKNNLTSSPKIVETDINAKNGQDKCPKCGSTDISVNVNSGKLRCNFCRFEFDGEKISGLETDISKLNGEIIASGAKNISADTNDVLTFKCSSCGAEVVIDTSEVTQARCHWCRNTLSVNQQIPNGSVPDVVLPFAVKKEEAKDIISKFVGKRKFYANPKFKKEFTLNNIMGVYFPYMLVDINAHSNLKGKGEHKVRQYTQKENDKFVTYYDADLYDIEREFDVSIEGLTVESSSDKLNKKSNNKTTNVINAIMPFDIENAVKWNANYLKGFSSERRDTNIDELKPLINRQTKDIAKFAANETLKQYDRGVVWDSNNVSINGQQWKSAYLPVWLYSYQEVKGNKKLLHYIAVNARTKETMGSVPIYMPKLIGISLVVEVFGVSAAYFIDWDYSWIFVFVGFLYFFIIFSKYRNQSARHKYESDTKTNIRNLVSNDQLLQHKTGITNPSMIGANNTTSSGDDLGTQVLGQLSSHSTVANMINDNFIKK